MRGRTKIKYGKITCFNLSNEVIAKLNLMCLYNKTAFVEKLVLNKYEEFKIEHNQTHTTSKDAPESPTINENKPSNDMVLPQPNSTSSTTNSEEVI